jgi:PDZ domain-containing protein
MCSPPANIVSMMHLSRLYAAGFVSLAIGACSSAAVGNGVQDDARPARAASLGLMTSIPSELLVRSFNLNNNVRVQGRLVDLSEGPAAEAGLRQGDVILQLGENDLYSQDDITDFLKVSTPGDQVPVIFRREAGSEPQRALVTLGAEKASPEDGAALRWQYASLAQLPKALEVARAQNQKVMVGLSGAET